MAPTELPLRMSYY